MNDQGPGEPPAAPRAGRIAWILLLQIVRLVTDAASQDTEGTVIRAVLSARRASTGIPIAARRVRTASLVLPYLL
jgi:hypothetical protein